MGAITRPACSSRGPAFARPTTGRRSFTRRWPAEVLLLVFFLSACAPASRISDDLTTSTQVKIALVSDAQAGGLRLNVSTLRGVVTLSGTVKSDAEGQHAVAVARAVHGVRRVTSELKIEPQ